MGRWENKYVIGLTGNIATGKSLVRRMLEHLGAYTIDADGLTHQVMAPGAPAYQPVITIFGQWILDSEKRIDRSKLSAVVFSHPEALARLEALTHPVIGRAIDTLIQRARQKVVVVEAIKLLEGQLASQMDAIWVVDAPEDQQLQRLAKRGLSPAEAQKRVRVQNPQADKIARATVVIHNNSTPEAAWAQVRAAWSKIQGAAEAEAAQEKVERIQVTQDQKRATGIMEITSLDIMRGGPRTAHMINALLRQRTGKDMSKDDLLMRLGEKSYLLAVANGEPVGLIGLLVDNLVTRVDELFVVDKAPVEPVARALVQQMEVASRELQSEVGYIFLPPNVHQAMGQTLLQEGYEKQELEDIKIPAWREAARESRPDNTHIFAKKLRAERVLKPL